MKHFNKINLLLLLLVSCGQNATPTAQEIISKYSLTRTSYWWNESHTLLFSTYTNYKTDSLLVIVLNHKGDTLLKYTGRCISCNPTFSKQDDSWLVTINNAYQNPLYFERTGAGYDADMYFQDSLHYYVADTVNFTLEEIYRASNDSIVNMAKRKFGLNGHWYMVHEPFSKWLTIAKDTLDSLQVYYKIDSSFETAKINSKWSVIPSLDNIYMMGLYENRKTVSSNYIVSLGQSPNAYCFYTDWHNSFSERYFLYNIPHQTEEIWLVMRKCDDLNQSKVLLKIPKKEFSLLLTPDEHTLDPGFVSQARINIFKFYNDYFITTNLPDEDEAINYIPNVFLIDTLNWILEPIKSTNEKLNNKIKKGDSHPQIFGDDYKSRGLNFVQQFNILKTDTGFLIVPKNRK